MIYLFSDSVNMLESQPVIPSEIILENEVTKELNGFNSVYIEYVAGEVDVTDAKYVVFMDSNNNFQMYKILSKGTKGSVSYIEGVHKFLDDLKASDFFIEFEKNDVEPKVMMESALSSTKWVLDNSDTFPSGNISLEEVSPLEVLEEVLKKFPIEIDYWIEFDSNSIISQRYALKSSLGVRKNKFYEYGSNVLNIEVEHNTSEIYTAAIGLGATIENENNAPQEKEVRIDFSNVVWSKSSGNPLDKPKGSNMLVDDQATIKHGYFENGKYKPRITYVVFDDIKDPKELIKETHKWLVFQTLPKAVYRVEVFDGENVDLGDEVAVRYADIGVSKWTKVSMTKENLIAGKKDIYFGDVGYFNSNSTNEKLEGEIINLKKSYKNYSRRIYELKLYFDKEFTDRVTAIENEFQLKLDTVTNEIQADQERMENEMSQMKLEQQQRVEEIMTTIGEHDVHLQSIDENGLLKSDFILKPDGFILGNTAYDGSHMAQAILGKAGAIDLIADNVNLSNNLNVANQIKSLSLETVYANISELRTRMLVADVITADMLKADTAMFEKFTSSTAFINSLFAKSATIGHIQAIDIDLNRATVTGGDSTNYIRMTNQNVMSYGTFTRSWGGETDTARLELGLYDGQLRMRNLDTGYRLYLTERGLSTSMEGAIDQFTSGTLEFHSQRFNKNSRGVTLHSSYGAVAMVSDFSTAYIRSNLTANIESNLFSIYFRPYRQSRPGVNEFRLWVKDGSDASATDGVLSYGNADAGAASGIRFQKSTVGRPMIWATNGNGDIGTGNVRADSFIGDLEAVSDFVYAIGQRMRVISNKNDKASYADIQVRSLILEHSYAISNPGNQDVYFGVGGGELRLTNNNHFNAGNPSYRDLRLRTLRTMSSYAFENHSGGDTYFGVGGGKLLVTDNNHWNGGNIGWRDIEFRNWKANSHERYKTDISEWNLDVLDLFKELQLYQYKYKDDLENNMLHRGIVLREDSTNDKFPAEWRQDDGYNGTEVMWWTVKGVQELAHENDSLKSELKESKSEIEELKTQINKIMEMIA